MRIQIIRNLLISAILMPLALVAILTVASYAEESGRVSKTVTTNGSGLYDLNANGDVAFKGFEGGRPQVFVSKNDAITEITNNQETTFIDYIKISDGGQIVWNQYDYASSPLQVNLYLYANSATRKINTLINASSNYCVNPAINSSGLVVWQQYDTDRGINSGSDIFLYNGSTIRITSDLNKDEAPAINNAGKVVWTGDKRAVSDWDTRAYLYDGSTTTAIGYSPGTSSYAPQIAQDGSVVYVRYNSAATNRYQLNHYATGKTQTITGSNYSGGAFSYNSGRIAYVGSDGQIYLYDGGATKKISTSSNQNNNPMVNSLGHVAWFEADANNDYARIVFYDGTSVVSLTGYGSYGLPYINSRDDIVWSDGSTIYMSSLGSPSAATLIAPSGTIATSTPAYAWNAVANSSWYLLYVKDSSASPKIQAWYSSEQARCSSGAGTCSVTPTTAIAPGAAQWWIQTWNNQGYGPWSNAMSFTVSGGGLPGKANLVSPSGTISTALPAYTWNAVAGATWYLLWVNDSTTSSGKIQNWYAASEAGCGAGTGNCSITPSIALAAGAAQWWIQTYNSVGYGPWSTGMAFTVGGAGPPGKAVLLSPAGTINSRTPAYTWNAVTGATWYLLWVNDSAGSARINRWYTAEQAGCSSDTGNCSVQPDTALAPSAAQWWIQTWNPIGFGPWSDAMNFTVIF